MAEDGGQRSEDGGRRAEIDIRNSVNYKQSNNEKPKNQNYEKTKSHSNSTPIPEHSRTSEVLDIGC